MKTIGLKVNGKYEVPKEYQRCTMFKKWTTSRGYSLLNDKQKEKKKRIMIRLQKFAVIV